MMTNAQFLSGLVIFVYFILVIPAHSMDNNDSFRVMGDFSCSEVLDRSRSAQVNSYIQGFATATNVWLQGRRDHFKGMVTQELVKLVISSCSASPLSTLGSTLTMMVSELTSAD